MNRFSYFFIGLAATFCLIWTSASAVAQTTVIPDATSIILETEGYHEFHIAITNNGFGPLSFYVVRTVNELPDDAWQTSICMGDYCYASWTDETEPVTVEAGATYNVKLNVLAGTTDMSEGRFVLKFIATASSGGNELGEIEFTAEAQAQSSVPAIVEPAHLPFPNPATADITIPLTAVSNAQQVAIFNVTGSQVALFDQQSTASNSELRLNLADFAPGAYYYKITGTDETKSGSFSVVK